MSFGDEEHRLTESSVRVYFWRLEATICCFFTNYVAPAHSPLLCVLSLWDHAPWQKMKSSPNKVMWVHIAFFHQTDKTVWSVRSNINC
jgi:hypothetical protein